MRALGVDFGGVRIGIALGESEFGITSSRPAIRATGILASDAKLIAQLATEEQAEIIVVGVPFEPDQTVGKMARVCLKLTERIRETGFDVHTIDESLTSVEAENNLRGTDLTAAGRRRLRDGEAARLILERFFDEQKKS